MTTATTTLGAASEPRTRSALWKLLPVAAIVAVVLGSIVGINYNLDPLTYSTSQQREVAAAWTRGANVAMFDANVDLRELRREQVHSRKEQ